MKIGNIAPDINFDGDNFAPNLDSIPKGLIDFDSKYSVVVFGASWCPKCVEEIPEIVKLHQKWKEQGVEVIFVSLDENKEDYKGFVKNFPFFSTCDYQKWESKTVNDYYVFGTPTMYLLDNKREIILRPNSVKQMDAWVDWYLIEKDN
jgi:thiol-disulfide isomerase/thioredoxin